MKRYVGIEVMLITLVLLVLATAMGLLFAITKSRIDRITTRYIEESNKQILFSLEWAISPLMEEGETEAIQRLLENIGASRAVKNLRLYDRRGRIAASNDPLEKNVPQNNPLVEEILAGNDLFVTSDEKGHSSMAIPVKGRQYHSLEKSDISWVLFIRANRDYYSLLYSPLLTSLIHISFTLGIILSLLALVFIRLAIHRPLKHLMHAIEAVEEGDYQVQIDIRKPYEFRRFADMFTTMLSEIREKNDILLEYSEDLEEKVRNRTKELHESMQKLRDAQKTIIHQEKMATIGQLSAGVAHEINNPTAFVIGNLATLREYLDVFKVYKTHVNELVRAVEAEDERDIGSALEKISRLEKEENLAYIYSDLDTLLDELDRGAVRIKDIVQGLRDFARADENVFEPADINTGIENALRIAWNKLKYRASVEKRLGKLPSMMCNLHQLEQVFINLLTNAADAIQTEGSVVIETREEDGAAVVSVTDTGCGMSEEVLDHIFEPFFTTKEVGRGTGLGLSISHGIIEDHGGSIDVKSTPGFGTTFTIRLPLERKERT